MNANTKIKLKILKKNLVFSLAENFCEVLSLDVIIKSAHQNSLQVHIFITQIYPKLDLDWAHQTFSLQIKYF